ncbi:MAG: hypothetical protein DNFNHJIP_00734 [Candidatus Argoarchaeum ethanivorans]|uniref:Uncharacterized protein n=1 Tax=Candidatus Argoarchaeum ethanivorans TaxID=2608793 RepID=A0A812A117_9EURY|nr:MAG: hypothetical protein DNFNHJIP_00716 [Candidatus Argoarchaeum ethanivorans]CAD7767310.1 MAG: hypothetical protein DNFNHJIP_00718 [Candidatus Argoarchaeum ethanivorans]CAD7767326.1 MAG: hypothetical protein DNFNHJIP_00734 [Candidatus Argoarchaeum ethanivorans]
MACILVNYLLWNPLITNTAARKPINVQTEPTPDFLSVLMVVFTVAVWVIV